MKFHLSIYGKYRIYQELNFRLKSKDFHDPGTLALRKRPKNREVTIRNEVWCFKNMVDKRNG